MLGDIQVHFDPGRGELTLTCGGEAFGRLRRAVCAEAAFEEITGHPADRVRSIEIVSPAAVREAGGLRQAVVWLGCTLVGSAFVLIFAAGVVTVFRWLVARFA